MQCSPPSCKHGTQCHTALPSDSRAHGRVCTSFTGPRDCNYITNYSSCPSDLVLWWKSEKQSRHRIPSLHILTQQCVWERGSLNLRILAEPPDSKGGVRGGDEALRLLTPHTPAEETAQGLIALACKHEELCAELSNTHRESRHGHMCPKPQYKVSLQLARLRPRRKTSSLLSQ